MIMKLLPQLKKTQGAMALVAIIVIMAVGLVIGLGVILNSLTQIDMNLDEAKSLETFALAEACVDESLIRLKRDINYTGGSLNLEGGSCIINIINISNQENYWEIRVTATIDKWVKKIYLELTDHYQISHWQEI